MINKKIRTVTGFMDVKDMGITSMHEHVMPRNLQACHRADSIRFAVDELKKARKLGLNTLIEVSPWRDAELLKIVSEQSEMQIVACTGFYPIFSDEQKTLSIDHFRRHMLEEFEHGIGKSGVLPGVLKIGSQGTVLHDFEIRALTAAGMAQKETGLPLCVHSVAACKQQQDVFEEAGADLSKIYFSHVEAEFGWEGRSVESEIDYLQAVVEKGSCLSYNNFGNWAHTKPENLARIMCELNKRGFSGNQVATMDMIWEYKNEKPVILWEEINEDGARRTYSYLLNSAVPWMRSNGVSDATIDKLIRDNPRRIFS